VCGPLGEGGAIVAGLTALGFISGTGRLHGWDPRFKIAALVLVSLASLKAGLVALSAACLFMVVLVIRAGTPPRALLKDLKPAIVLLCIVFIARALSTPGESLFLFGPWPVSREGMLAGGAICLRLLLVLLAGVAVMASTRLSEIKTAVEWFLTPIPGIPEKRVGTMLSLIVRFLPHVLDQARETGEVQRARGIENRKNPVYRVKQFAIPVLRRTFLTADQLALAMEARCYSDDRTDAELVSDRADWMLLAAAIALSICLILF